MITNTNITTPFSFSSFENIEKIVRHACSEKIAVLGINDLNTVDGFKDFFNYCNSYGVYPLFNVGFFVRCDNERLVGRGLLGEAVQSIIHINGKALRYPARLSGDSRNMIASIWKGSQDRIWKMIELLNIHCKSVGVEVNLDYNEIRSSYAKITLFEQHLAIALYHSIKNKAEDKKDMVSIFRRIFEDPSFNIDTDNVSALREEIRNRLLAKGRKAYVEEPSQTFISLPQARQIIIQAGGIPSCQLYLTESNGPDVGKSKEALAKFLSEKGIHVVEFIPQRTTPAILREFMHYFDEQNFCVVIGTGLITGISDSLVPKTIDGNPLDEELIETAYRGACVLAAHQEMHNKNMRGFIDETGKRLIASNRMDDFIKLGDKAIRTVAESRKLLV